MQGEASNIIRTIRQALGMSQAEFARALGWGTSTISRWESGKAQPNRLAMKIILAFGEERGVRYRPRAKALPAPATAAGAHPPVSGPAVPALAVPVARPAAGTWSTSIAGERAGWEAQLNFRVAIDRGSRGPTSGRQAWFTRAVAGGALCTSLVFCIALLTATPARTGRDVSARRPAARVPAEFLAAGPTVAPAIAPSAATAKPRRARGRRRPVAPVAGPATVATPVAAPAPSPPPQVLARLEGVTLLGGVRTATFRTDADSISLSEGEKLGERHAVRVGGDGVDLRDAAGRLQTVKLGDTIPVE
jgi:DNA-binding XRE family transcriptional regulator